jgi:hypothetical protein
VKITKEILLNIIKEELRGTLKERMGISGVTSDDWKTHPVLNKARIDAIQKKKTSGLPIHANENSVNEFLQADRRTREYLAFLLLGPECVEIEQCRKLYVVDGDPMEGFYAALVDGYEKYQFEMSGAGLFQESEESVAGLSREKEFKDASDTSVKQTTRAMASDQTTEPTDSEREQFVTQSDEERAGWLFDRVQEIRKDLGHI